MKPDFLKKRAQIIREIRNFFWLADFIETDTPALVLSPGMEPHIRPVEVAGMSGSKVSFLQTSPEFAMKKILSHRHGSSFDRIFQICKCYRFEPTSSTHHPEFTMIEWYRANSGYEAIMNDVESLFETLALNLYGKTKCLLGEYGEIEFAKPWPRLTVAECFEKFAAANLRKFLHPSTGLSAISQFCLERGYCGPELTRPQALERPGAWDDFFFLIFMNAVEPALKRLGTPVIIYRYPESQAALSNIDTAPDGFRWAKRFEVYAGGLELGNAFDELTDASAQRARFEKDMELRKNLYNHAGAVAPMPISPIDEEFLDALKSLPPSGGIAMGIDRLVMLFVGTVDISDVLWQKSHLPQEKLTD